MELNLEQSTSLHCSSWIHAAAPHAATNESWAGPGIEGRVQTRETSGLAVLEQLNVESNSKHS